jgi:hypothetical protein
LEAKDPALLDINPSEPGLLTVEDDRGAWFVQAIRQIDDFREVSVIFLTRSHPAATLEGYTRRPHQKDAVISSLLFITLSSSTSKQAYPHA